MIAYILLAGIVVFGFASALWVGSFLLNRGLDTNLENAKEGRRHALGQLGYGILFIGITILLSVIFFQMNHEPIIPLMPEKAPNVVVAVADTGASVTLVFSGIFLCGAAFLLWLFTYVLSSSIYATSPSGRSKSGQLTLGGLLLGATVVLTVLLFSMDRTALVPDLTSPSPGKKIAPTVTEKVPVTPNIESQETAPDVPEEITPAEESAEPETTVVTEPLAV